MISRQSITLPVFNMVLFDSGAFGTNDDIIASIYRAIPIATKEVATIAHRFQGKTIEETGKNIWKFLRTQIRYKPDKGKQVAKYPPQLLSTGIGDCKSFALFTGAILNALNIPFDLRFTNYIDEKGNPPFPNDVPSHVYVRAFDGSKEIIIDAVYDFFNHEKIFYHKKDFPMRVLAITGLGQSCTGCSGCRGCNSPCQAGVGCLNKPSREALIRGIYGIEDVLEDTGKTVLDVTGDVASGNVKGAATTVVSKIKNFFSRGDDCSNVKKISVYDFMKDAGDNLHDYTECWIKYHTKPDHDQLVKGWSPWGFSDYEDLIRTRETLSKMFGESLFKTMLGKFWTKAERNGGDTRYWFMNHVYSPFKTDPGKWLQAVSNEFGIQVPQSSQSTYTGGGGNSFVNPPSQQSGFSNAVPWLLVAGAAVGAAFLFKKK